MKINILSPGRFHVCDLARELDSLGFDVRFYSYVPTGRVSQYGLPRYCCHSLSWLIAPFAFLERKSPWGKEKWATIRRQLQDLVTSWIQRDADVTIAMSGEFNKSIAKAKKRGNIIISERGSKHILDQKTILDSNPSIKESPVSEDNVKRELLSYELADYIAVGAKHVEQSFLQRGYKKEKIFVNPYGVDLPSFRPLNNSNRKYDFLMVGTWSYQKGSDLLASAISKSNYTLLHVGSLGDVPFPSNNPQFVHVPPVNQLELSTYYNQCKVFILPSRQDGLAMVLVQAVACHLPIIASSDGGACDLQEMVENSSYISIIRELSVDAIIEKMNVALRLWEKNGNIDYAGNSLDNLTWAAYGKRYSDFLNKISL